MSTSSSRELWNPEEVLQLCNNGTCIGYAPSQRRKCRMAIRYENEENVAYILADISVRNPDPEVLRPKLRRLAQCGLCVQFHQYQIDDMVEKWTRWMRSAFPIRAEQNEEHNTSFRSRYEPPCTLRHQTGALLSSPSSIPLHSTTSTVPTRQLEALQAQIASMQLEIVSLRRQHNLIPRIDTSSAGSPASNPDILLRRTHIDTNRVAGPPNVLVSDTRDTPASTLPPIIVAPNTSIPPVATPSTPSASSPVSSSVSLSNTHSAASSTAPALRCTRNHARRLPLDEECPICYEGGLLSEQSSMDLVWCRSGCGRTVHRSCFEDWRATSVSRNIEITCAVCRGPWSTECECEGCIHVVRRVVEGDCTICLEALIDEDGTRLDDLTWCKDGCGKSVHKHCFDVWKTQCQNRRTDATCVMCRVRWNDRCEC